MTEPVSNNRQSSEISDSKCEEVARTPQERDAQRDAAFRQLNGGEYYTLYTHLLIQMFERERRETRRETLLEAAEICNMVCEKIAAAKNQAGNTEKGRALQRCVWTAFACEQQILLLIDNDAKKAAELERKAKEI